MRGLQQYLKLLSLHFLLEFIYYLQNKSLDHIKHKKMYNWFCIMCVYTKPKTKIEFDTLGMDVHSLGVYE